MFEPAEGRSVENSKKVVWPKDVRRIELQRDVAGVVRPGKPESIRVACWIKNSRVRLEQVGLVPVVFRQGREQIVCLDPKQIEILQVSESAHAMECRFKHQDGAQATLVVGLAPANFVRLGAELIGSQIGDEPDAADALRHAQAARLQRAANASDRLSTEQFIVGYAVANLQGYSWRRYLLHR